MIIAAMMSFPSLRVVHLSTDLGWEAFWHFVKTCLALSTLSVNATRPLFASDDFKVSNQRAEPVCSSSEWCGSRKLCIHNVQEWGHLPSAPTVALTGIPTWIRRGSKLPAMTLNLIKT